MITVNLTDDESDDSQDITVALTYKEYVDMQFTYNDRTPFTLTISEGHVMENMILVSLGMGLDERGLTRPTATFRQIKKVI